MKQIVLTLHKNGDDVEVFNIDPREGFEILFSGQKSQAATMALSPGEKTGGPDNRHEGSDQWMYIIYGTGKAVVEKEEFDLKPGILLLIKAGETHEIKNTGKELLETLNIYAPPAYPSG